MQRWKLTIEYDGRPFKGWQRQEAGVPSVQEAIEAAIYKFCQQSITVYVAGRTDAGVHARGQVAHFDLDYGGRTLTAHDLAKALNAHMRDVPVVILKAEEVESDFHARFMAINKLYIYRLACRAALPTYDRGLVWQVWRKLDVAAMREGAAHLLGHHDFSTFRDSECQAKSPMRTLDRLDLETLPYDGCGGIEIRFHVEGRSFLHHQVRNMVGTLVLVGEGKWQPQDVRRALEACDRTKGGPTAPPEGLYLARIDYP
ncbi:MAG: tRNA pseudouridine(38-40) synthase TruA [Micavibrio aeruginosavorus]|uniref:tRNA pseudouridine synthase A n=1 Tax=Micavibrio aeruginosavorus TaxID=349221 RepID=A0A7T5R4K0_9BACT|nr:MAG: tRNA pseudouridine(38-40) synthase TruA [Micavibrio aeruginosavorus]